MKSRERPQENWLTAGYPITGDDIFMEVIHEDPPGQQRFYRVIGTVIPPP